MINEIKMRKSIGTFPHSFIHLFHSRQDVWREEEEMLAVSFVAAYN